MSVRPEEGISRDIAPVEGSEDGDDEGIMGDPVGEDVERLGLPRDGEFVRRLPDPKLPTEGEIEEHCVSGHIPYRNWCPICVKAKGKEADHIRGSGNDRGVPEYSWDYCFPGDEMGYRRTILVARERIEDLDGHGCPDEGSQRKI